MNNPQHNSLRRLIGPAFLPRNVARLREGVAERVQRQFDALVAAGGGDALQEIAFEIPSDLICQLMGVPPADRGELAKLTNSVATLLFEASPGQKMIDDGNDAVRGIDEYFGALVEERRRNRGADLISIMLNVKDKSEDITDYELLANVHFMYGAGYEETHCFIASGIFHLLANPGLAERQRSDGDGGTPISWQMRSDGISNAISCRASPPPAATMASNCRRTRSATPSRSRATLRGRKAGPMSLRRLLCRGLFIDSSHDPMLLAKGPSPVREATPWTGSSSYPTCSCARAASTS